MKLCFIIVICFAVILIVSCSPQLPEKKEGLSPKDSFADKTEIDEQKIFDLKSELQRALISGGITQERYEEIDSQILYLESQNQDKNKTNELRGMLSRLVIGGQSPIKSNNSVIETIIEKNNQESVKQEFEQESSKIILWDYDKEETKWKSAGTPPECPSLVFESPIDVSKATAILYPGQQRGKSINDYKSHGGFRYDSPSVTSLKVAVPFDGYVWRGSRFLVNGEVQYSFDIVNECGIMHRLGHLTNLSPEFQKLADMMPEPKEGDSRTTVLQPFIFVSKGDFVATQVKTSKNNIGADWGVYDFRKENEASKNPEYREKHWFQRWYDFHSICWLDYISEDEQSIVKSLPGGDGISGKSSDYCNQ